MLIFAMHCSCDNVLLSLLCILLLLDSACGAGSVQIVGGTMGREGRAEACYNNQWGTICDDNWGTVDARVFCRHIGYPSDGMSEIIILIHIIRFLYLSFHRRCSIPRCIFWRGNWKHMA